MWKYFTLETPQSKTAKCNVCKFRGGGSLATYNATNTIKYLQKHPVREPEEFFAGGQKDERSCQESLLESFQKRGKLRLLNFIVLDDQLLSVVDNEGFRQISKFRYQDRIESEKMWIGASLLEMLELKSSSI